MRRAQKTVESTLIELGVDNGPVVTTRATCGAWLALRAEIIAMMDLKRRLQNRSENPTR